MMGKPDVDETEIAAGSKAVSFHYGNVIGENSARNIAYIVLCAARGAKSDLERRRLKEAAPTGCDAAGWPDVVGERDR